MGKTGKIAVLKRVYRKELGGLVCIKFSKIVWIILDFLWLPFPVYLISVILHLFVRFIWAFYSSLESCGYSTTVFFYKDSIRRFCDKLLENLKSCIYTYILFNVQFNQSAFNRAGAGTTSAKALMFSSIF